jgi:hypothetical protein
LDEDQSAPRRKRREEKERQLAAWFRSFVLGASHARAKHPHKQTASCIITCRMLFFIAGELALYLRSIGQGLMSLTLVHPVLVFSRCFTMSLPFFLVFDGLFWMSAEDLGAFFVLNYPAWMGFGPVIKLWVFS